MQKLPSSSSPTQSQGVKRYVFVQQGNGCEESRLWFAAAFVLAMVYLASASSTVSEAATSPELA